MSKSTLTIDTLETCDDCPLCIYTKEEKKYIGYCQNWISEVGLSNATVAIIEADEGDVK